MTSSHFVRRLWRRRPKGIQWSPAVLKLTVIFESYLDVVMTADYDNNSLLKISDIWPRVRFRIEGTVVVIMSGSDERLRKISKSIFKNKMSPWISKWKDQMRILIYNKCFVHNAETRFRNLVLCSLTKSLGGKVKLYHILRVHSNTIRVHPLEVIE